MKNTLSHFVLLSLIVAFTLVFSLMALQQHYTYHTNGLDLGNVDQALWNTAQGCFLCFSLMTPIESRLALHVEPILLVLVPFYKLNLGSPELLLVTQAFMVALGAWPLYLIAQTELKVKSYSLVLPVIYLLLPTLEAAVLYDFHAVTFAPTFILFAYHAFLTQHNKQYWLFIGLTLACKEDMPLLVIMMAFYIALTHRRFRLAITTASLSLIWFIIALLVIQPMYAQEGNIQLDRYDWLGVTLGDKLQTCLTDPGRIIDHLWVKANLPHYLFSLFFPTAFLAVFSPTLLLPMLPSLAVNLLSDNPFTWRLEDFHYGAPLAPFLLLATLYTLQKLENLSLPAPALLVIYALLLTVSLFYHYQRGFSPLARPFYWPEYTPQHAQLDRFLATVPPDIPLFAQSNLAPHLTHRRLIYSDLAYFTDPAYPAPQPAAAIVLDVTRLENRGQLHEYLQTQLFHQPSPYRLQLAAQGFLYFERTDSLISNPPLTSTFLPPALPLAYTLPVTFGDKIRLHQFALHFHRQEEVQVSLTLELLSAAPELRPVLYLLDEQGQPLGATSDLPAMSVWLPQWPVGVPITLHFNTLPWYTRDLARYRLALGLIHGAEVWAMEQRLTPLVGISPLLAPRLAANGTLLELARLEQLWGMPTGGPMVRQFTLPQPVQALSVDFNHSIRLLGYDTPDLHADQLSLTLYWQALNAPLPPLTRFGQLIGADGQLYGQNDSAPDRGQYPTPFWQAGEVVAETITLTLPPHRPTQPYTFHVGFYHPENGQRLLITPQSGDHVEITLD